MTGLKNILLLLMVIILVCESCRRESIKDMSLNPEAYRKLGMPDHQKIWTNDDYYNANFTLSSLKIDYPLSLPRKISKKSGELFNRFVNEENLSFVSDTTIPLNVRAYRIQSFERLEREMEQIYTVENKKELFYNEELIDLKIFGLYVNEKMLELAWKIMDSEDESDRVMQSGMKAVKNNYLKLIIGLLNVPDELKDCPANQLNRMSEAIFISIKKNQEWFLPSERTAIISRIEASTLKSSPDHIKDNIIRTLKALNDSNN